MSTEPTTYTAAVSVDSSVVAGDYCDVLVAEATVTGYKEREDGTQIPETILGNNIVLEAVETSVRTDEPDAGEKARDAADEILEREGWQRTGPWAPTDYVLYAPVARAVHEIAGYNPGRSFANYDLLEEIEERHGLGREEAHETIHAMLRDLRDDDPGVILEKRPQRPQSVRGFGRDRDRGVWLVVSEETADHIREGVKAVHPVAEEKSEEGPAAYLASIGLTAHVTDEFCDVEVVEADVMTYKTGNDGTETPVYESSTRVAMPKAKLSVRADDPDAAEKAQQEADAVLERAGWRRTEGWTLGADEADALVERA